MDPEDGPPEPRRWHMGHVEDEGTSGFRMVPVMGNPHGHHHMERTGPPLPPGFELPRSSAAEPWDAFGSMDEAPDLPPGFAREEGELWEDVRLSAEEDTFREEPAGTMVDSPPEFLPEPDDWSPGDTD